MQSRTTTAFVGLVASLVVTAAAWVYFETLLVFLLLPFVPVFFRHRGSDDAVRECPACGFRTDDASYDYCPHDGTPLD